MLERSRLGEGVVGQEFREAMFAHTLYRCPSFMFQDDKTGKKVCIEIKGIIENAIQSLNIEAIKLKAQSFHCTK